MNSLRSLSESDNMLQATEILGISEQTADKTDDAELVHGPPDVVEALKEQIKEKKGRILELEAENHDLRQHRVRSLYQQQTDHLTIQAKQHENDNLQCRLSELESQNSIFLQQLATLRDQVVDQNQELRDKRTVLLNHEAVRSQLARLEAEHRAVVAQRDQFDQDRRHAEARAADLFRKVEELLERIAHFNGNLITLKDAYENKLLLEQQNTTFWQHKYECEHLQGCVNYQHHDQTERVQMTDVFLDPQSFMEENRDGEFSEQDVEVYDQQIALQPEDEFLDPQTVMEENRVGKFSEQDVELYDQQIALQPDDKPAHRDIPAPRTKKQFEVGLSCLPHCKNCSAVIDGRNSPDGLCRFHLSPPQPYKAWKVFKKDETSRMENKQLFYWPCCDQIGMREPPGCKRLRHHDIIFPFDGEE